jgi:hypothetical protein
MVFKRRQCSRKLKTVHFCKRSPWTRFEFFLLVGVRGIEPLTLCLQSTGPNLSNLAGADATRLNVATSSKTQRALLHLFVRFPFAIWPDLLRLVLRFYYGGGCLNISGGGPISGSTRDPGDLDSDLPVNSQRSDFIRSSRS